MPRSIPGTPPHPPFLDPNVKNTFPNPSGSLILLEIHDGFRLHALSRRRAGSSSIIRAASASRMAFPISGTHFGSPPLLGPASGNRGRRGRAGASGVKEARTDRASQGEAAPPVPNGDGSGEPEEVEPTLTLVPGSPKRHPRLSWPGGLHPSPPACLPGRPRSSYARILRSS